MKMLILPHGKKNVPSPLFEFSDLRSNDIFLLLQLNINR